MVCKGYKSDNPLLSLAKVAAQRDEKRNDYAHFRNRQELMNIIHVSLLREKVNEIGDLELGHDVAIAVVAL